MSQELVVYTTNQGVAAFKNTQIPRGKKKGLAPI